MLAVGGRLGPGAEGRQPSQLFGWHVQVHRLNGNAPRSGESVEDEVHAGEESGGEARDVRLHGDAWILEQPSARFDVDGFARGQSLLEDVAVPVQPENALARGRELVDEETSS